MNMDILKDEDIKRTKKPHRCFGCLDIIPAGSPAHVQVNNDLGKLGSIYTHIYCEQIMRDMEMDYDDTYSEGCVLDEMSAMGFEGKPEDFAGRRNENSCNNRVFCYCTK
jgi:hypothetical protein